MDSLVKNTLAVPIDLLGLRKFTQSCILNMYPSQVEGFLLHLCAPPGFLEMGFLLKCFGGAEVDGI